MNQKCTLVMILSGHEIDLRLDLKVARGVIGSWREHQLAKDDPSLASVCLSEPPLGIALGEVQAIYIHQIESPAVEPPARKARLTLEEARDRF